MFIKSFFFALLFFGATLVSSAADPAPVIRAKVSFFAQGDGESLKGLSLTTEGRDRPAPISLGGRGVPFIYSGPVNLTLFREVTTEKGKTKQVVTTVVLPNQAKEVLVFLGAADNKFRVLAINVGLDIFPEGSLLGVNFTGKPMALRLDKFTVQLAPGVPQTIGPIAPRAETYELMLGQAQADGEYRRLSSRLFMLRPNTRLFLILLAAPGTGEVQTILLVDVISKGLV